MGQDQGTGRTAVTGSPDPEQIEREIEQTREELGDTIEALARKTDVKARAKRKVHDTTATVAEKTNELLGKATEASPDGVASASSQVWQQVRGNPLPVAAGAFLTGFLAARVINQR